MEISMKKKTGLQFYKRRKKINMSIVREIISWIVGIVVAVFVAAFLSFSVGIRSNVIGASMEPELQNGQTVLINQLLYDFIKPQRGDIIAFLPNGNQNSHYYVKRVVGLPGETVQIIGGSVFINGVVLEETYDFISEAGIAEKELVLKTDEYFVLGDNRNNSEDSRSSTIGAVSSDSIIGKVWLHYPYGEATFGFVD